MIENGGQGPVLGAARWVHSRNILSAFDKGGRWPYCVDVSEMNVNKAVPTAGDIEGAAGRLQGRVRTTPILRLETGCLGIDIPITLKLEYLQVTGSFKSRGALNSILCSPNGTPVVAASGGNHGTGVAWAAAEVGVPATVFVPVTTPLMKQALIRHYGADLRLVDGDYLEAMKRSRQFAAREGAVHVDANDATDTVAGQATIGLELISQIPEGEPVVVGCGGGGLYAGVALAMDGRNAVVPAEPEGACGLAAALHAGQLVDVELRGVALDSLGVRRAGEIAFQIAKDRETRVLLVSDVNIMATQQLLWDRLHIAAELGAVVGLSAVLREPERFRDGVTVIISGANADFGALVSRS